LPLVKPMSFCRSGGTLVNSMSRWRKSYTL
jgi:hypothetical protein